MYIGNTKKQQMAEDWKKMQGEAKSTGSASTTSGAMYGPPLPIGPTLPTKRAETYGPPLPTQGPMPQKSVLTNPDAALDNLYKNVMAGNVPNSGSGIIPTTRQKIDDFSGSAITSNNTVLSDVEKLSPSGVTYTKPIAKNDGTKKEEGKKGTSEGKSEYATEPVATPNPEDYGFSMDDFGGFSYGDFQVSDAYTKAMEYTNSLLSQLNSGRTSYSDKIDVLMKQYQMRDDFAYDASTDAMFQQMLASAMNSGKMAMQDTIGQAAALTGGYGNTYGTAAGNAAYNQYISDAYSNLPEYYSLALDAYNMEGDKMLSELAMLRDADSAEYSRLVDAYSASLDAANSMYDREYTDYLNDRNAAESDYWNDLNFRYGAYLDGLNQANKDREFNYRAEQDNLNREERSDEREYQRVLDKAEWDYKVAKDAISVLDGAGVTEYDSLTKSELDYIKEIFVANGGASGNGFEAANQALSVMGKNNFSEEVGNDLVAILEGIRSPVEDYADAINGIDYISQERKEELIRELYEKFAMKCNK